MTLSSLDRLALAGMVALLLGAGACAETPDAQMPEPTQDDSIAPVRTRGNTGDAEAQVTLGLMYATGEGVPQDAVEAVALFRQAAEQGQAQAQYTLGVMYDRGEGVPQDDVEAVARWRKAAEQANVDAQYNLGVMYYNGTGVPQNDGEAYLWAGTVFFAGYDARYDQGNRLDTQLFSTSRFLRTNHAIFTKLQYLFRL